MTLVKKPKHVASYCKQKGICLPTKLCRLSAKVFWFMLCVFIWSPENTVDCEDGKRMQASECRPLEGFGISGVESSESATGKLR